MNGKVLDEFAQAHGIENERAAEDEFIYQNSFKINYTYYVSSPRPRAFVLSHGRNLMILKAVGYAEQVARFYQLENQKANLWIGHQRYPTRGKVWHPGGAHPFVGLHEALVHNGDFANYHAITEYLRQRGMTPLFVTDTEVGALLFDFYARVLGYPLEFLIEALAPTPEGDFERLNKRCQRIYRVIQTAHMHGSPDGPWFFIVARTEPETKMPQLIGITDVSMLRPQMFAIQSGEKSFGAIASEKQAIDAFFEDLSASDSSIPPVADRYWNARGGSCTDGGAFVYTLKQDDGKTALDVRDKFGNEITVHPTSKVKKREESTSTLHRYLNIGPDRTGILSESKGTKRCEFAADPESDCEQEAIKEQSEKISMAHEQVSANQLISELQKGNIGDFFSAVEKSTEENGAKSWKTAVNTLPILRDRRWDIKGQHRANLLAAIDRAINRILDSLPFPIHPDEKKAVRIDRSCAWEHPIPEPQVSSCTLVIDASGFPPEGNEAVSRVLVEAHNKGWKNFIVYRARGDRFIGCGLGPKTDDVRIDVFGSSGDYLGSGMDGAQIYVHGDAQDQVGQILKSGLIVIFGSVGQTFLYGAKGGEAYVMGSAAGRPLINAVGHIRAVINGTCLDYCAESFMAGNQLDGGFVIINGLSFDEHGEVVGLDMKYPGNNLFSLASGGACYLNDPYRTVTEAQLNGASFIPFKQADWNVILPYLRKNEEFFGISIRNDLLTVDGVLK